MRIVSMVPSGTEIVAALGMESALVGRTYGCDYPPSVRRLPVVVESTLPANLSPRAIDAAVRRAVQEGRNHFRIRWDRIRSLRPDVILTQGVCTVCAVDSRQIRDTALPADLQGVTVCVLRAGDLTGVAEDIRRIGAAIHRTSEADRLAAHFQHRLERLRTIGHHCARGQRPRVLILEWTDPPIAGGHWVPEMVIAAGGEPVLSIPGNPSRTVTWAEIADAAPEVIIIAPCGYGIDAALQEATKTNWPAEWWDLPAVRAGRVWAVDANAYFSRPGPRLLHGIELILSILWTDLPTPVRAPSGAAIQILQADHE